MSRPVLIDGRPALLGDAPFIDAEGVECCCGGGGTPTCDCDACPSSITVVVDIEVAWSSGRTTFLSGTWILHKNSPFGSCTGYGNGNGSDTVAGTLRCEEDGGDYYECELTLPNPLTPSKAICFTPGIGTPTPPSEYGTCGGYPAWMMVLDWGTTSCDGDGCDDECGVCIGRITACVPLEGYGDCPGDLTLSVTYPTDAGACGCGTGIDSVVVHEFSVT